MQGNANKVVVAVAAVLVVLTLALVVGSGSCSGGGGGGGGAPAAVPNEAAKTVTSPSPTLQGSMPVGSNARNAAISTSVPTASSVYADAASRGFSDAQIEADFDISGNYSGMVSVDRSSAEKRPSYMFSYESAADVVWFVYVNEGSYMAIPMAFGTAAPMKEIIFTESDTITQYDGTTNEYSDFTLDQIAPAVGVKVDKIDAATLDSYTSDQLEKM